MNKDLLARLLDYYHISEEEYASLIREVNPSNFALGHHFNQMEEAVAFTKDVMKEKGNIFIYGDYDADGVMGTSILVKMFKYVNYPVESYLPNRYQDGYGLTLKKAQECIDNNVSLVITVDNGVSAFEPILLLKDHGVKVLVLDHHTAQEELPVADYIIHPLLSHFGETPSSGAFTAFMFSIAFLGRFDKYLAILASISLISDMMPLKEYNRDLLRLMIQEYKDGEFYQIDILKDGDPFDENSIGMKIAPKINAIGRICETNDINKLVNFFTDDKKENLLNYINWINETNEFRKDASKEAVDRLGDIPEGTPAIVYLDDIKEGLLGLVANHLVNKYHVPTIVFSLDHTGESYKGSCRAPEGFNIVDAFNQLKDLTIVSGGHPQAGGCTVSKENFEEFKKRFIEISKNTPIEYVEKPSVTIKMTELTMDNYDLVQSFSPFGESWKAPLFKLESINTGSLFYSRNGEHILTQIGNNSKITGFYFSRERMQQYRYVDLIGSLRKSEYRGIISLEFLIKEIFPNTK